MAALPPIKRPHKVRPFFWLSLTDLFLHRRLGLGSRRRVAYPRPDGQFGLALFIIIELLVHLNNLVFFRSKQQFFCAQRAFIFIHPAL